MTRIYIGLAIAALLASIIGYYGHTRYKAGAADVQTQWDKAKGEQMHRALTASEAARITEHAQAADFAGISSTYLQATTHAYPSIADALPAAIAAGTVRLQNDCPAAAASGGGAEATARSRGLDAAATQALADRVQAAIAAVRTGDEADARERLLGAQVIGLQAVLTAERATR